MTLTRRGGVVHVNSEAFVRSESFVLDGQGKAISLPTTGIPYPRQATQASPDQLGWGLVRIFQLGQAVSAPHGVKYVAFLLWSVAT